MHLDADARTVSGDVVAVGHSIFISQLARWTAAAPESETLSCFRPLHMLLWSLAYLFDSSIRAINPIMRRGKFNAKMTWKICVWYSDYSKVAGVFSWLGLRRKGQDLQEQEWDAQPGE